MSSKSPGKQFLNQQALVEFLSSQHREFHARILQSEHISYDEARAAVEQHCSKTRQSLAFLQNKDCSTAAEDEVIWASGPEVRPIASGAQPFHDSDTSHLPAQTTNLKKRIRPDSPVFKSPGRSSIRGPVKSLFESPSPSPSPRNVHVNSPTKLSTDSTAKSPVFTPPPKLRRRRTASFDREGEVPLGLLPTTTRKDNIQSSELSSRYTLEEREAFKSQSPIKKTVPANMIPMPNHKNAPQIRPCYTSRNARPFQYACYRRQEKAYRGTNHDDNFAQVEREIAKSKVQKSAEHSDHRY